MSGSSRLPNFRNSIKSGNYPTRLYEKTHRRIPSVMWFNDDFLLTGEGMEKSVLKQLARNLRRNSTDAEKHL